MEGYHLSALHHQTLHKVNPTKLCRHFPPGEAYFGYHAGFSPDLPRSQKGHPELSNSQLDDCVMLAVPPGLAVGCASDYSSFICIQPESIDRVRVKQGLIFFGPDWPQATVDWAVDLFQKTMAEDKAVLVNLAMGLKSRHYRTGPLGPADCEGPIWDFYSYVNRRMGSAVASTLRRHGRPDGDGRCSSPGSEARAPACRTGVRGAGGNTASPTTAICATRSCRSRSFPTTRSPRSTTRRCACWKSSASRCCCRRRATISPGRRAGRRGHRHGAHRPRHRGGGTRLGAEVDPCASRRPVAAT